MHSFHSKAWIKILLKWNIDWPGIQLILVLISVITSSSLPTDKLAFLYLFLSRLPRPKTSTGKSWRLGQVQKGMASTFLMQPRAKQIQWWIVPWLGYGSHANHCLSPTRPSWEPVWACLGPPKALMTPASQQELGRPEVRTWLYMAQQTPT